LHQKVVVTAREKGVSVNFFVKQAIEHELYLRSSI